MNEERKVRHARAMASLNAEQLWAFKVAIMAERRLRSLTVTPEEQTSHMDKAYEWALQQDEKWSADLYPQK
jgi:hypothetical protein